MPDAAHGDAPRRNPREFLFVATRIVLLVSVALGAGMFFVSGPALLLGPVLGLPSAVVALLLARSCWKRRRVPHDQSAANPSPARAGSGVQLVAAVLLGISHGALALGVLSVAREVALSGVSAANLRGIGEGLKMYHADRDAYAACLADLVAADLCTPHQFVAGHDPGGYEAKPGAPLNSSYIYQPGTGAWCDDPRLIVALERGTWVRGELKLFFGERGRFVLFADGRVGWLCPSDFVAARSIDRTARRELGWPPPAEPDSRERKTD